MALFSTYPHHIPQVLKRLNEYTEKEDAKRRKIQAAAYIAEHIAGESVCSSSSGATGYIAGGMGIGKGFVAAANTGATVRFGFVGKRGIIVLFTGARYVMEHSGIDGRGINMSPRWAYTYRLLHVSLQICIYVYMHIAI